MPPAKAPQPPSRAGQVAKAYAAAQGAQAAAKAPTIPPAAAALGAGALATVTAATMSAFITWLAETRRRNQAYLATRLSRRGQPGDVAKVIQAEMLLEQEFARRAADRLATKLPAALAIADRAEREAAVRQALADEERYGRQRQEAMLARALAALTRSDLRSASPLGAFWKLGLAQQHTRGCLTLAGRFWPWAVLDRVHPPRHYGCTSSLHGYHEAVGNGLMRPEDVPDTRAAVRAAAGVMMEGEAGRVLAELDVRDRLEEMGVDTAAIPFAGVAEAFEEVEHPRDWKGRFRTVGDVAATMAARSSAWMVRQRGSMPADAPSREQITKNWTRQLRGTLSQDRQAIGIVAAAQAENAKNDLYQRIVAAHEPDHVVVTKPRPERTTSLMFSGHGVPHRVAGTTAIPDEAVRTVGLEGTGKTPADRPAASSGYGMAAVLRHEYGHSIDDLLPRDVRRRILDAIPDPESDLTYYAGTADHEVIPELLATITHPDYRAEDWPATVQEAERRLLATLGVKREEPAAEAAAALKRGEEATIDPKHAPALVEALADGEASSLHKLQVTGHPNLFRAHARELARNQMPQIPKADLPGFMDFLRSKRVAATAEEVAPSELRATQNQINGAAVAAMAKGWDPAAGGMMMVSRELHVLDGHHRWGSMALYGLTHPDYRVQVLRFSAGTDRMLALMREYNVQVGTRARGFALGGVPARGAA